MILAITNGTIIDGKGNDPAWQQVEWASDFIQREPHENAAPTEKTAFKILYDNNALDELNFD